MEKIYSLRGATTLEADTREQIFERSAELFNGLMRQNNIRAEDISASGAQIRLVNIICGTTADITAAYPAEAIRKLCGCGKVPLFSCLEPPIKGGLPLALRLMVTVCREDGAEEFTPKHVYLHGAKELRPDINGN